MVWKRTERSLAMARAMTESIAAGSSGRNVVTGSAVPDSTMYTRVAKLSASNGKRPDRGEMAGTDLHIPSNPRAARAAELPKDKSAKITVYCRSGNESAIAAQTLIDLGYTNIDNLDGGMTAWTASGRQLVQLNRT